MSLMKLILLVMLTLSQLQSLQISTRVSSKMMKRKKEVLMRLFHLKMAHLQNLHQVLDQHLQEKKRLKKVELVHLLEVKKKEEKARVEKEKEEKAKVEKEKNQIQRASIKKEERDMAK